MNLKYLYILPFTILSILFSACSDNDDDEVDTDQITDNQYVNNWIYEELADVYFWNYTMPSIGSLDLGMNPYDFFYKKDNGVLYKYQTASGDRFSRIEGTHLNIPKSANLENTSTSADIGFEYMFLEFVNNTGSSTGEWAYLVLYIKKGSQAEKQGLKRGHVIRKVDDTGINSSNRFNLLAQNKGSYKLSIDDYEKQKQIELTINVTPNYKENPIYLDSIYTVNSQKIGYIVYNSYEAGGEVSKPYDVQLAGILKKFETKGVKNLILDLRYNGGGFVNSAKPLISALVPDRDTKQILEIKTYNPSIQAGLNELPDTDPEKRSLMYDYFVNEVTGKGGVTLAEVSHLGDQLDNLYVLTTGSTASASEMTINTLRPYMKKKGKQVIQIGERTLGKNVGSWAVYTNDDAKNTYVMWPIIFKSHNVDMESEYSEGFTPQIKVEDIAMLRQGQPLKNLGDKNETLLSAALSEITKTKSYTKPAKGSKEMNIITHGSSLEKKQNANLLLIEEEKSTLFRKQLKSLKQR